MKSDTPRTDSAEFFVATTLKLSPDEGEMHVTAFFARQLEREPNEALVLLQVYRNEIQTAKMERTRQQQILDALNNE